MSGTNTLGNPHLERVYGIKSVEDCRDVYDSWAETFDKEISEQDYRGPVVIAQAVIESKGNISGTIYDAGCGTGLSGVALRDVGAKTIDGVDVSPGMLKVAEKTGAYKTLAEADLTKPIDKPDATYDVVTCVGTLTHGHVGPVPALREFVRITKDGGLVVATVLDDIWVSGGYEAEVDKLKSEGLVDVLGTKADDYRKAADVKARTLILRKK